MSLDADAEHEAALLDVHVSLTACPKLTVAAWAGELNMTDGCGAGLPPP